MYDVLKYLVILIIVNLETCIRSYFVLVRVLLKDFKICHLHRFLPMITLSKHLHEQIYVKFSFLIT